MPEDRARPAHESYFRELLEAAPDAMVIVDDQGRIVLINAQAERLFGYPRDELLDLPVDLLLPERFRALHARHRAGYAADPRVRPMGTGLELVGRARSGQEFPVEVSLSPLHTRDGTLVSAAVRDITERKRIEDQLAFQARHDTLTGVPNRRFFMERLERTCADADAHSQDRATALAVLYVDLDGFKHVNDTYGHDVGDVVLQVAASRLRHLLRESDTLARLGGDEFVALLSPLDPLEESRVATRVVEAFKEPVDAGGVQVSVTASVGVARRRPGDSAQTVLRNADTAMYTAKRAGRSRWVSFGSEVTLPDAAQPPRVR